MPAIFDTPTDVSDPSSPVMAAAMARGTPERDDFMRNIAWHPQPLRREVRPEEYPIADLPPVIADAVREVQAYVQAPMAMVAACALSVVSAAVQTRFGVQRDAVLQGPATLYMMSVAASGERKTAIDKLFMAPLRRWEAEQGRDYAKAKALYDDEFASWEEDKAELDKDLAVGLHRDRVGTTSDPRMILDTRRPKEPRNARMLRGDDTPEALCVALQNYPIAAIISSEAGVIFGSHSMGADKVQGNLAQINVMWDGGPISQDRIGRERVHIETLRATMGLQVQPSVLEHFVDRTGGLARGIGFFARFLFSQPETTQGTRFYVEPTGDMPALRAFGDRITALLNISAEFDDFDQLMTHYIWLDAGAHKCWAAFHDEVEEQLGGDDVFSGIRDVASKAAENAARLACCYHAFNTVSPIPPPINRTVMNDACAVMRWYLAEAVRFGQVVDVTEEVRNAELAEEWLVRQLRINPKASITVNMLRQKGPGSLRQPKGKIDAAIELLQDHGRIRALQAHGTKSRYITVAPQVIREWS